MSGKVVLLSKYFDIRTLAQISYLKLWNYIYIYIYIVRPSVPSCPSRRRRRRLSVRPVVVVCPLSVLCLSVRPLSVRPSDRPSCRRRPFFVRQFRRGPSSPSSDSVRPSVPSSVSSSSVLCQHTHVFKTSGWIVFKIEVSLFLINNIENESPHGSKQTHVCLKYIKWNPKR